MIEVSLFKANGRVTRVRTSGHSGLAESGRDLLCAAVSALVQTAYLALVDIYGDVRCDRADGFFEFDVPDRGDVHDADVIINAMRVGIKDLASGYPQNLKLEEHKCL